MRRPGMWVEPFTAEVMKKKGYRTVVEANPSEVQ